MARDFRKLQVWQRSLAFVKMIYNVVSAFPSEEKFSLTQQTKRAAYSVTLNITEGAGADSRKDFNRFLSMAKRSAFEVIGCFEIAITLGYVKRNKVADLIGEAEEIAKMINGLQRSIIEELN